MRRDWRRAGEWLRGYGGFQVIDFIGSGSLALGIWTIALNFRIF
jgi:hypothetical protein